MKRSKALLLSFALFTATTPIMSWVYHAVVTSPVNSDNVTRQI